MDEDLKELERLLRPKCTLKDLSPEVIQGMRDVDMASMIRYIRDADATGAVLRGHIMIQRALSTILRQTVPRALHLKSRLSFVHLVEICTSLDLVDPADFDAYMYLNRMRNDIAHELHYGIGAREEEGLFNCASPAILKTHVRVAAYDPIYFPTILKVIVSAMYAYVMLAAVRADKEQESLRLTSMRRDREAFYLALKEAGISFVDGDTGKNLTLEEILAKSS